MSITVERKQALIKEHARGKGDTGSPEVQVAILTERINNLTQHFKSHANDNHSWSTSAARCSIISGATTKSATPT